MQYVIDHYEELLGIVTGLVTVAAAIAALTPTPRDDGIVAGLRKVVDVLALNVGHARNAR